MSEAKTVHLGVEIEIPKVPNYLRLKVGDGPIVSVADFTNAQLQIIAERWAQNLIARAEEIRNMRKEASDE